MVGMVGMALMVGMTLMLGMALIVGNDWGYDDIWLFRV
jgi:hypothetical protein